MIKLKQAVIVEGKYDKIKLSNMLDALIIETNGFGVFKDKEKQAFIRRLGEKHGILILTDSDAAGFQIRSFLGGMLPPHQVTHAYIPDIFGKERRKEAPSKEGKLGVEGMSEAVIRTALLQAGILFETSEQPRRMITNADLYAFGFSGTKNAKERRLRLLQALSLPARLSTGALLKTLNTFLSYEEFLEAAQEISGRCGGYS
ncbi:MAG: DUF4093 domain-containing protein [Oscillospiraceae bacterium]|jgi:ribonuclease M5|nr:DUF4093 domain-containing protein [Oscillospiraceae bacterium]